MNQWKWFLSIIFMISGIIVIEVFCQNNNETYSLKTLKTTGGYVVDIRAGRRSDITQPVYCTVMKSKEVIFPLDMIGSTTHSTVLEFVLIEDENDEFVAIIEKASPYVILALYDLKEHKSWPSSDPKAGWREEQAIGQKLLHRWNQNRSGKPFVLSGDVPGGSFLNRQK